MFPSGGVNLSSMDQATATSGGSFNPTFGSVGTGAGVDAVKIVIIGGVVLVGLLIWKRGG